MSLCFNRPRNASVACSSRLPIDRRGCQLNNVSRLLLIVSQFCLDWACNPNGSFTANELNWTELNWTVTRVVLTSVLYKSLTYLLADWLTRTSRPVKAKFTPPRQTWHRQDCLLFFWCGDVNWVGPTARQVHSVSGLRRSVSGGTVRPPDALRRRTHSSGGRADSVHTATADTTRLSRLPVDHRRRDAGQAGSCA